jgi:short subunit dehydrogenase-like uncharacterized protein
MSNNGWMIYGAYGYTGGLIAEEAVRRGHRPLLSGRSPEKLAPLADRLGLEHIAIDLGDEVQLQSTLDRVDLVLNVAGPFVHTAPAMLRECLKTGTSYLDVSGETLVIEQAFTLDRQAREVGIAIIPGVGFNVLASDCLVSNVAEQVAHPTHLEIATRWITDGTSPGSIKTMIETFPIGTLARREGQLMRINARAGLRQHRFIGGVSTIQPAALGDLATAFRTTRIPNITTYTAVPEKSASFYSLAVPIFGRLFGVPLLRRIASRWVDMTMSESVDHQAEQEASQAWALARNALGIERQAWLETVDSYQFTAEAAVRSVEKLIGDQHVGVLTPAMAFGADFVLEIPGSRRVDRLDDHET